MKHPLATAAAICSAIILCVSALFAQEEPAALSEAEKASAVRLSAEFESLSDLILTRHYDPPTRQHLLLHSLKGLYALGGTPPPPGLARRVSDADAATRVELFGNALRAPLTKGQSHVDVFLAMRRGMSRGVPGGMSIVSSESLRITRQLRDNLYVGIGIRLSRKEGLPIIDHAFPRGPAYKAGSKDGDAIIEVDGVKTKGLSLAEVVKMLRGPKGAPVEIVVQFKSEAPRKLALIRAVVPIDSVRGQKRKPGQLDWDFSVPSAPGIALIKIDTIKGSTVAELRTAARKIQRDGFRGVVLDLSSTIDGEFRHSVMLADALLGEHRLGYQRTAQGQTEYKSDGERILADLPLAVVVTRQTRGGPEWVAAALQDHGRAMLVGGRTAGFGLVHSEIEMRGGKAVVSIYTGMLLRSDGRSLHHVAAPQPGQIPRATPVKDAANAERALLSAVKKAGRGLQPDVEATKSATATALRALAKKIGKEAES